MQASTYAQKPKPTALGRSPRYAVQVMDARSAFGHATLRQIVRIVQQRRQGEGDQWKQDEDGKHGS